MIMIHDLLPFTFHKTYINTITDMYTFTQGSKGKKLFNFVLQVRQDKEMESR